MISAEQLTFGWQAQSGQLWAALEGMADGVMVMGSEAEILYLNPAMKRLHHTENIGNSKLPLPLDDYLNLFSMWDLKGNPLPREAHPLAKLAEGTAFQDVEVQIDAATGGRILNCSGVRVVSDAEYYSVLTARDITAQKRAEQRYTTCFEATPAPTLVLELGEGKIIDINSKFSALVGYTRDAILGCTSSVFLEVGSLEDALASLRGGEAVSEMEMSVRTSDGEVRRTEAAAQPMELSGDACAIFSFIDVTGKRQTEEQLMQAIQEVMQDTAWFSRSVMERLAQIRSKEVGTPEVVELTQREQQVLERIARGQTNDQICAELQIAKNTVRNYITRIYDKLGVHSRAEAVVWARQRGMASD